MPDPTLPFDRLLRPIVPNPRGAVPESDYAPDGSGRDYAYEYDAIEDARHSVAELAPRGDEHDAQRATMSRKAKPADWGKVLQIGTTVLSEESKDLRVAAWMVEALGHLRGFAGLRDGFALMRRLQGRYWASAYPQLDDGDAQARAIPYQFLDSDRLLPFLIRSIPLTDAPGGVRLSFLRHREASDSERQVMARPEDERDEAREALKRRGRIFADDWTAAVAMTPDSTFERLARDLGPCLASFKACDKATERLFGRDAPGLTRIEEALLDCAELVASILAERESASSAPLGLAIGRVKGERRPTAETREVEADPEPEPIPDPWPEEAIEEAPLVREPARVAVAAEPASRPSPQATPSPIAQGPPIDAESAYRRVREAADFLREANPDDPVPYLLIRSLRLGELYGLDEEPTPEHLPGPPRDVRKELRRLAVEERWEELAEASEKALAEPEGRGWLDAHRLGIRAAEEADRPRAARACRGLLAAVLADFPELPGQELDDGTASASAETRAWLDGLRPAPAKEPGPERPDEPTASVDEREAETDPDEQIEAAIRGGRIDEALTAFSRALDSASGDRERFLRTRRLAELCLERGLDRVAVVLLDGLAEWMDLGEIRAWEGRARLAEVALLHDRALQRADDGGSRDRLDRARARLSRLDPLRAIREAGAMD